VKPPPFAYAAPTTLDEAVGLLTEHADAEPRVLAGGQSLIPLMNFRLAKPGFLVDLRNVAGLAGIRRDGDILVIGAMTRMSELERSPEVAVAAPLLAEAVGLVAHTPVRNSATIGGSLAHADPAAELPAVALAADAELVATGPAGSRRIPAAEFLRGPFSTALAPDEILTEVRLPVWHGGHAFVEFSRIHANFAVVGVAALAELDGGRIRRSALAVTGVAPTAIRATAAEDSPWYVVPADNKWFTRLVVVGAIVRALEAMELAYPAIDPGKKRELRQARRMLMSGDRADDR